MENENSYIPLTPAQCRAARNLVLLTQEQLASEANVGLSTVRNFEAERSIPMRNNLIAIRSALELMGVEFIPNGVKLVRVLWRRTLEGELPPANREVLVAYTEGQFGTQRATFDEQSRTWTLLDNGRVVPEDQVPAWTPHPSPRDYRH